MEKQICWIKFNLPKYGGKLLEDYLDKIRKYVQEKKIEQEVYDDIENRIAEKLSVQKEITDMHIINLLNELGDAEEIFGQEQDNDPAQDAGKYKPFFLGLFSYIANKIDVNPWILRIVYFIFVFGFMWALRSLWWLWLVINIIAYIAIASKYNNKIDIKGSARGVAGSLTYAFRSFVLALLKIVKFFFKYIFLFIFVAFSIFFWWMALIWWPFFLTDFTIDNQVIFGNLSVYLPYGIIILWLVLCILWVWAIFSIFRKKFLNSVTIFVLIWVWFLSVVSIFFGAYKTASRYTSIFSRLQKINLWSFTWEDLSGDVISWNKHLSLIVDLNKEPWNHLWINGFENSFRVEKSPDDKIYILVKTSINSNSQENADNLFKKMNNMEIWLSGDTLKIKEINPIFKQKVVFSLPRREITLQIPEDISFDLKQNPYYIYLRNTNFFATGYFTDCYNSIIKFDPTTKEFVCQNKEAEIQWCKDFWVEEKEDCVNYLNTDEDMLACKRVMPELQSLGDISKYNKRQMKDYKYCTDVLYRRQTRECEYLVGTWKIQQDMRNYWLITYCQKLSLESTSE